MFDVIVVGGGLGGMLTAAILGRSGRRVLLLEREERLGGRLRSTEVEGGFVVDAGAYLWPDAYLSQAMERAGADSFRRSVIPRDQVLRLFAEGCAGRRLSFPFPLRQPSPHLRTAVSVALRADEDTYSELCDLWRRLVALSDQEVEALQNVRMADGLAEMGLTDRVAEAFRRNVMLFGTYDPDSASMAECIELCRRPPDRPLADPVVAGANPQGGVRALVDAIEHALQAAQVEVRTGCPVERLVVSRGAVLGVEVGRAGAAAEQVRAATVVANIPVQHLADVLPEGSVSASALATARQWSVIGGVIAVAYAFSAMPCLRETGEPDDFLGWTRLLTGPEHEFGGGMVWTTLHSPANAPRGCHVLQAMRLSPTSDIAADSRVEAVHDSFDRMVLEIYVDSEEKMLWSRRWKTADGSEYMISAAPRPPVDPPWLDGLYLVGETTDVPAVQMDAAALSAMRCADAIIG